MRCRICYWSSGTPPRGGLTTKTHALVEGLGHVARWDLTAGQVADITQAAALLDGIPADALINTITQIGAETVIPPRQNRMVQRPYDIHKYKHRNLIERWFGRVKHFRLIATRYENLARHFSAFIALVAAFVWLS